MRAERRPNVGTPVSRYRGTMGVSVDSHGRYVASPAMAVRPITQEGCQLVNHYEFAKGGDTFTLLCYNSSFILTLIYVGRFQY